MPPIRINPPGVKHTGVLLKPWRALRFRRMHDPNWPPLDSSPLIPLEPWGTQLLVFNANEVDFNSPWKGSTPRLRPKVGPDNQLIPTRPVMCVADFKRKPKLYLGRADFETLVDYLPEIKREMYKFADQLEEKVSPEEQHWKEHKFAYGRRSYAVQRGRTRRTHIVIKGGIRYPKT